MLVCEEPGRVEWLLFNLGLLRFVTPQYCCVWTLCTAGPEFHSCGDFRWFCSGSDTHTFFCPVYRGE